MSADLRPSRRTVLAAGLAGSASLLAGCSVDSPAPAPPPSSAPDPDQGRPDEGLRDAAATREHALLAAYDAAAAADPTAAVLLAAVREQHLAHLTSLLGGVARPSAGAGPSPSPPDQQGGPSLDRASPVTTGAPGPTDRPALVRLERSSGAEHAAAAVAAVDGALAGLLASLAASEASHAVELA